MDGTAPWKSRTSATPGSRPSGRSGSSGPLPPLVFLVDDDALLRSLVGDWVEASGFRALRLDGGAACLEALSQERPAAVILDLHMDGLSGQETLDYIRTADGTVPVIAMTADDDPAAAAGLLDHGVDDVLRKPLTPERLGRALRDAAGRATRHAAAPSLACAPA